LQFLKEMVSAGHQLHIAISYSTQSLKNKVKIHVGSQANAVPAVNRPLFLHSLDVLLHEMLTSVVVDRGHRHSDGHSVTCFWIDKSQSRIGRSGDKQDSDPPDDQDGDGCSDGNLSLPDGNDRDAGQHGPTHSSRTDSSSGGWSTTAKRPRTQTTQPGKEDFDDVKERVNRLDMLLLLTDTEHFKKLDEKIILFSRPQSCHSQPDHEPSPERPSCIGGETFFQRTVKCLRFDLTAENSDVEQDSSLDHDASHQLPYSVRLELQRSAVAFRWRQFARQAWENQRCMNCMYACLLKTIGPRARLASELEALSCKTLWGLHSRPFERCQ